MQTFEDYEKFMATLSPEDRRINEAIHLAGVYILHAQEKMGIITVEECIKLAETSQNAITVLLEELRKRDFEIDNTGLDNTGFTA